MTKYIVANFKQNFNQEQLLSWIQDFTKRYSPNPDNTLIIAPSYPFLLLPELQSLNNISLAAQTISPFAGGSHTGQIGASQLQGLVDYCIIGHSETRKELGDTDLEVAKEAKLLQDAGITPIICLDQPYLESQISVLKKELLSLHGLIFAYETPSAIGTGKPVTPDLANQIAYKIKNLTAKTFPVLYGGSVSVDNIHEFTSQDHLDGVIVGTDSLDPQVFVNLVNNV